MSQVRFVLSCIIGCCFWGLFCKSIAVAQVVENQSTFRLTPDQEVHLSKSPIRATVQVRNERFMFMVDTGASMSVIDDDHSGVLKKYGSKINVKSAISRQTVPTGTLDDVTVGGIKVAESPVAVVDLDQLSSVLGHKVDGLLGLPFVLKYGLGFDSRKQVFYSGPRGTTQFQKTVPLRLQDDSLVIDSVELAGTSPVSFEIDTGMNSALSVRKALFDSLLEKDLILAVRSVPFVAVGGVASRRHGVLRDAKFLGYAMKDVPISERKDSMNLVGLELLQRFDWFIDGNGPTISVTPNAEFDLPFKRDQSGPSLLLKDKKIHVDLVRVDSPSDRAGIKAGDILLKVDGQEVEQAWDVLYRLRDLFSTQSTSGIVLEFVRSGSPIHATLSW